MQAIPRPDIQQHLDNAMSTLHPTPRDILTKAMHKAREIESKERAERMRIGRLRMADVSRMASIEGSPEWQMMQPDEEEES